MEKNKLVNHAEFLSRIRKTLYYGSSWDYDVDSISRPLGEITAEIFSKTHKNHSLNRLNLVTVGNIINTTPCSLILSMIYLERLQKADPFYAKTITPTELFLVSMMVSTKFHQGFDDDVHDPYNSISDWAKYGGIRSDRLKQLELTFLNAIQWNLHVSNSDFFDKLKSVEGILAKKQSLTRGWMTYTELEKCIPSISIAKQIINYSTIMILSYACSLLTLTGAFLLASRIPYTHLYNKANNVSVSTQSFEQRDVTNNSRVIINNRGNLLATHELGLDETDNLNFTLNVDDEEATSESKCEHCFDGKIFNSSEYRKSIDFQLLRNWKKYSNDENSMNCSFENDNVWPPLITGKNYTIFTLLWFTSYL